MKRPKPRLYKGLRDIFASDIIAKQSMLDNIRVVYESYGFVPLETPAIEYLDVLGKYLPDSDTPEGGVFAFENPDLKSAQKADESEKWISLRYDLTASLARVAAQYRDIQRPFRRYQIGNVWRVEKPGPGRFREFCQFDFDTVGSSSMLADAEACTVVCDSLNALGFSEADYQVRVNNRKIIQGLLEIMGLDNVDFEQENSKALIALRAIDKLDRIGIDGVTALLGKGRMDESGDYTSGAELETSQISQIREYLEISESERSTICDLLLNQLQKSSKATEGINELKEIDSYLSDMGFDESKVIFDPTIVRGLGYYTGPVYECVLTMEILDEKGNPAQFGSIFGGGRYDNLVERFTGQKVPATGGSIGVDRLMEAVKMMGKISTREGISDVLMTVMDKSRMSDYIKLTQKLRMNGVKTEIYMGKGNIGKQLKYADKLDIPFAIIAGSDEFERGEYLVKDLMAGREISRQIQDRDEWRKAEEIQYSINADKIVSKIIEFLSRS